MTPATSQFYLRVRSSNAGLIWPGGIIKTNKELYDRIQETFYADEDEASASFDVKDVDDLMNLLRFYHGTSAQIEIGCTIESEQFEANATLEVARRGDKRDKAWYRNKEAKELSPMAAADKLNAIANSMLEWECRRRKEEAK